MVDRVAAACCLPQGFGKVEMRQCVFLEQR